jgi:heme-degrading monooxygenase HmoA
VFARVARYRIPEDRIDDAIEAFRQAAEQLQELPGNTGGHLLVDRDNCTALTITYWESRAALEASEVRASRLRSEAVGAADGEIQAVDRCELVLDFTSQSTA